MKLPMLALDTANHAVYGAVIALVVLLLAGALGLPHAPLIGAGAALLFGAGKEAADYASRRASIKAGQAPKHGVEWSDLMATVAGGVAVVAARLL